jgi:quercetin 2,3-dioxygenase
MHSEFNPSIEEPTHLLQIWLLPERRGPKPEYEQLSFWGAGRVNGKELTAVDGAAISNESDVRVEAAEAAEVLLFDLA